MSDIKKGEIIYLLRDLADQAMRKGETHRGRTLEEAVRLLLSAPPDNRGWRVDDKDSDRVYIRLTAHHELSVIHQPGEGIVLDNVDQRIGDVVDTRCLDLEDLNCCVDPDEV